MIPIQELLHRIQWDRDFAKGRFELSYYDRVQDALIRVPLAAIYFDPEDHFGFQLTDDQGEVHQIPLHRIREVFKDGQLIWERHAE